MALLYAKPVEYAIRALTYLAVHPDREPLTVHDIAEEEEISAHHLSKVMKTLSQHKLVNSLRGPGGGYTLVADPEEITLWKVLECFDAQDQLDECALSETVCSEDNPCALHAQWCIVRDRIREYLKEVTISKLAKTTHHIDEKKRLGELPIQIKLP
jgi:Rrf2 family iron-sulfur cluster assembly transcriptional regulator